MDASLALDAGVGGPQRTVMAEGCLHGEVRRDFGVEVEAAQMYWQVHTLDRMLEVLVEVEVQLKDMQRLAEARYRFGTADGSRRVAGGWVGVAHWGRAGWRCVGDARGDGGQV